MGKQAKRLRQIQRANGETPEVDRKRAESARRHQAELDNQKRLADRTEAERLADEKRIAATGRKLMGMIGLLGAYMPVR